jgi:hypothetical protein
VEPAPPAPSPPPAPAAPPVADAPVAAAPPTPPQPLVVPVPVAQPPIAAGRIAAPPPTPATVAQRAGRGRPASRRRRRLGLLLAGAVGLSLVVVWVGRELGRGSAPPATTVVSAAAATTQAKPPPVTTRFSVTGGSLPGTRVFEDRFSTTAGGWDQVDDATGRQRTKGGVYEIAAEQRGDHIGVPRARDDLASLRNVVVRVDARRVSADTPSGDPNGYGIACRQKDAGNFYWFNITNAGWYGVNKRLDGEQVRLEWPKPATPGIISATSPNHIQVMCAQAKGGGTRLVLWVNGHQLVDRVDRDRPLGPGGGIGVYGFNAGQGPSTWTYDNFSVWKV